MSLGCHFTGVRRHTATRRYFYFCSCYPINTGAKRRERLREAVTSYYLPSQAQSDPQAGGRRGVSPEMMSLFLLHHLLSTCCHTHTVCVVWSMKENTLVSKLLSAVVAFVFPLPRRQALTVVLQSSVRRETAAAASCCHTRTS